MKNFAVSILPLLVLAVTACKPTELESPVVGDCDDQTALNRWPQFVGPPPAEDAATGFNLGDTAPNFRLQDQFGDPICLWQMAGKVVLIDASALWCAPCKDIAKHTKCVAESYDDELVYMTFISQNDDSNPAITADAAYWSDQYNLGEGSLTPVVADGVKAFVRESQWVPSYPSFLVLDRDMTIVAKETGRSGEGAARAKATELIGDPSESCQEDTQE